ncbi:MAG: hypothetical protein MPW14_09555 [Candidatus Manganitrophus sp.]|nr:hypothetical protein [Candidatus Manganitrophus sp.]WDT70801.1 MAG: hypothetical protein MPW17_18950 [Candidatus Manganitrophus sp.]WDT81934.1 MAG: hypothetical protein MPW14_09555 [Candidatus Manganitrophus sp.]
MDERRIEKENCPVLFELYDGSEIEGEVFLRLYEAHHAGLQKVGDLINEDARVIPLRTSKGTLLLNRSRIALAKVQAKLELDDLMTLGKKYTVNLKMLRGKEIQGDIYVNLPEGFCRVKDYFNQPIQFFPLIQSEFVVYINRELVLFVQD